MSTHSQKLEAQKRPVIIDGKPVQVLMVRRPDGYFALCQPVNISASARTIRAALEKITFLLAVWIDDTQRRPGSPLSVESSPKLLRELQQMRPQTFRLFVEVREQQPIELHSPAARGAPASVNSVLLSELAMWDTVRRARGEYVGRAV